MAKRARKTKPAFDPVRTEEPEEDFSAAALRALAAERLAREEDYVVETLPAIKADCQTRVRKRAMNGFVASTFLYDRALLARLGKWSFCSEALCLAVGRRLTDDIVASWFPGCRYATVMADADSIDINIRL